MATSLYSEHNGNTVRVTEDGQDVMANFVARIVEETRYVDGMSSKTTLKLAGRQASEESPDDREKDVILPTIEIDANEFAGLSWVMPNWGVRCLVRPGNGLKDDLRAAIQSFSTPEVTTVYRHIGWTKLDGRPAYLHAKGAIKAGGNDKTVRVELPSELTKYELNTEVDEKSALIAAISLGDLFPESVSWSLLAGALSPLFGPVDFAVHLSGRTGTFKSEVMSLFQSLYGPRMDARNLPGSWSSTANALEALSFFAKNAAFVIDDFIPSGTSWQIKQYQQNADKIVRAQGNQAGRARLTDISSLQTTMYPRGIVLSTGEDTPEGHSVRARMMILELAPGDVKTENLTKAQKLRPILSGAVAAITKRLAKEPHDLTPRVEELRAKYLEVGHTRTPAMMAKMVAVLEYVFEAAEVAGAITDRYRSKKLKDAIASIEAAGRRQHTYLEDSDPVDQFMAAIRQVVGIGTGHFKTLSGGIPQGAESLGWTKERSQGEMPNWKSRGTCIGWVDWNEDALYLDVTAGYNIVRKAAGTEIALTKNTLFKRMKDSGTLTRVDDGRQRNTVRVTADGHPRQVLQMSVQQVFQTQEVPNDGDE